MSNITTYLVSASLILLVIRQIREHPLDARSLATPVLAVGAAAVMFLHSVPAGGSDLALEAACVAAGAAMGAIGGLATRLRLGAGGRPLGRAGILAASMWIGGVGARLAFAVAAGNGAGPGHRPVFRRAPDHRLGRLGGGPGDDGPGRRADPAGGHLPARPPAGRRLSGQHRCRPGRRPRLTAHPPAAASCLDDGTAGRGAAPARNRPPGECPVEDPGRDIQKHKHRDR